MNQEKYILLRHNKRGMNYNDHAKAKAKPTPVGLIM